MKKIEVKTKSGFVYIGNIDSETEENEFLNDLKLENFVRINAPNGILIINTEEIEHVFIGSIE